MSYRDHHRHERDDGDERGNDDWEDDDSDEDWDDDQDGPDDDEPTVPCPNCRRLIHEEAERCPYCEHYITAEDARSSPQPLWIVLGVIACLLIIYCWVFGFPR